VCGHLVQSSGSAGVAAWLRAQLSQLLGGSQHANSDGGLAIIDVHTHFWDPHRQPVPSPWPGKGDGLDLLYRTVLPPDFEAVAGPCGVTGTVVVAASGALSDQQWVLDLAAKHPGCIVGLCGSVAPDRPEFAEEIRTLAKNPLFRGIRAGPPAALSEDSLWWDDMALLAELDLQLDVMLPEFTTDHYAAVLALADRLPSLRIVINHIGMLPVTGGALGAEYDALLAECGARPNIFMKVSGTMEAASQTDGQTGRHVETQTPGVPTDLAFYRPVLEALWTHFGEDRLIYGSNWPVCDHSQHPKTATIDEIIDPAAVYRQQFDIVHAWVAEKGEAATAKFFSGNAKAAYKWVAAA
jgi:L-fuconolactonase